MTMAVRITFPVARLITMSVSCIAQVPFSPTINVLVALAGVDVSLTHLKMSLFSNGQVVQQLQSLISTRF